MNSAFRQLAERFTKCGDTFSIDRGDDSELLDVMTAAGKALHAGIKELKLQVPDPPPSLLSPPKVAETPVDPRTGQPVEVVMVPWATYWWHAVLWLARSRPEAGIVLPSGGISRIEPDGRWWQAFGQVLPDTMHPKAADDAWAKT